MTENTSQTTAIVVERTYYSPDSESTEQTAIRCTLKQSVEVVLADDGNTTFEYRFEFVGQDNRSQLIDFIDDESALVTYTSKKIVSDATAAAQAISRGQQYQNLALGDLDLGNEWYRRRLTREQRRDGGESAVQVTIDEYGDGDFEVATIAVINDVRTLHRISGNIEEGHIFNVDGTPTDGELDTLEQAITDARALWQAPADTPSDHD